MLRVGLWPQIFNRVGAAQLAADEMIHFASFCHQLAVGRSVSLAHAYALAGSSAIFGVGIFLHLGCDVPLILPPFRRADRGCVSDCHFARRNLQIR